MAIRRASWLQTRLSGSQVPVSRTRVGVSDRRAQCSRVQERLSVSSTPLPGEGDPSAQNRHGPRLRVEMQVNRRPVLASRTMGRDDDRKKERIAPSICGGFYAEPVESAATRDEVRQSLPQVALETARVVVPCLGDRPFSSPANDGNVRRRSRAGEGRELERSPQEERVGGECL